MTSLLMDTALTPEQIRFVLLHELAHIRRGALLHDVGKLKIPEQVLHKPADELLVLTNFHVIKGADEITVRLHNKKELAGKIVFTTLNPRAVKVYLAGGAQPMLAVVTGGTGFLGSHLVRTLQEREAPIEECRSLVARGLRVAREVGTPIPFDVQAGKHVLGDVMAAAAALSACGGGDKGSADTSASATASMPD